MDSVIEIDRIMNHDSLVSMLFQPTACNMRRYQCSVVTTETKYIDIPNKQFTYYEIQYIYKLLDANKYRHLKYGICRNLYKRFPTLFNGLNLKNNELILHFRADLAPEELNKLDTLVDKIIYMNE